MHVHRLVVDVVLDGLLAGREGSTDGLLLVGVGGRGKLRLQLRLERPARQKQIPVRAALYPFAGACVDFGLQVAASPLGLHHQFRAGIAPAGVLGRRERDHRLRQVPHLWESEANKSSVRQSIRCGDSRAKL